MACKFELNGYIFNNELELDDFLISKGQFLGKFDSVFDLVQASEAQLKAEEIVDRISAEAKQYAKEHPKRKYGEDGELLLDYKPPFIGVTKFLSGLQVDGKLMFPEFREDAYFNDRISKWKNGEFNDDEKELVADENGNTQPITDPALIISLKNKIKRKWKYQGVTGTAIHKIFELYFRYDNISEEHIKKELRRLIDDINRRDNEDEDDETLRVQYTYEQLIPNDNIIKDTLDIAKKLKSQLEAKYGEGLKFYPELEIKGEINQELENNPGVNTLKGTIDLLVIDKDGVAHIIDYKTSPKDYTDTNEYSNAKRRAFWHQIATYNRILNKYGLNSNKNTMLIVPVQLNNFSPLDDGTYTYDGLKPNLPNSIFDDVTGQIYSESERSPANNIAEYIDVSYEAPFTTTGVLAKIKNLHKKWFPTYGRVETISDEEIKQEMEELKCYKPNDDGYYVYKTKYMKDSIQVKADEENAKAKLFDKVKKYKLRRLGSNHNTFLSTKAALIECLKHPEKDPEFTQKNIGESKEWFTQITREYRNEDWEVLEGEKYSIFDELNIIPIKNKRNGRIDFISISSENLAYIHKLAKGDNLIGTFDANVTQESKQDTLVLKSAKGNIELMKVMAALNELNGLFEAGLVIGKITVANPIYGLGVQASNEELAYNFAELCKNEAPEQNNFANGKIKLCTKYELLAQEFFRLIKSSKENPSDKMFERLLGNKSESALFDFIDDSVEEKVKKLEELKSQLENDYALRSVLKRGVDPNTSEQYKEYISLYNNLLMTIADLKGYTFRQQLKDHDEWFENANIFRQGISGTRIDNPGNLNSDTLNLITKMVATAYQNVRQELQTPTQKFTELVEKLKKEKGYGKVGVRFFENQANLYSNLFRDKENYIIKDLKDLHGSEREFAEYFLQVVNENRFRNKTKEQLAQMRDEGVIEYYQIPLKSGDLGSKLANKGGMFNALKFALKRFNLKELPSIKEIGPNIKQKISDFFESDEYQEVLSSDEELFQMSNNFDQGESNREETLQKLKNGKGVETNLETLGLSHIFAYSVKDNIDEIFPIIKAAKIHLITQGSLRNIEGGFKNDIKYIEDYIKSNIKNESILSEKEKLIAKVTTPLKRISSFATLAFSPVQFLYQMLQGLWNDISLVIRKPDGTEAFTFKHFLTAIKIVYADMFKNEPTLCSRLNELYGLNDMDMNQLVDRLKSDNGGFLHLNNFFMKFSSRPDYYNRLTIFICQLLADGSLKAHSLDSKGQLVYDWTKDDRFSLYAKYGNNPSGLSGQQLELYNKQKSLYISTAKQLVKENTYTGIGRNRQLFIYNPDKINPLPKAYTTLESESMKELADNIYGYYSHEKKSMIHAGLLGSMWMQFRTYWSGKKNQYVGSGGIKLRGRWKTIDGLWYNERGEIVKEDTGVPVTVWEGDWQEGIALTLSDMVINTKELGGLKNSFLSKINSEDPKLRLIYRNNLLQLGVDTCMWLIGGVFISGLLSKWLKDFLKDYENVNMTLADACEVAGAKVIVQSIGTSFIDFRWFESIGEPAASWTPFAFEWVGRTTKRFGRTVIGNEDWWDFAMNSFSAGKQLKPILDTIKPDVFKTESEGGTFVPRRERKENI